MTISRNSNGSPAFNFAGGITASFGDVYGLQTAAEAKAQEAASNLKRAGDEAISLNSNHHAPKP